MTTIAVSIASLIVGFMIHYSIIYFRERKDIQVNRGKAQQILGEAQEKADKIIMKGELKAKDIVEKKSSELDKLVNDKQKELSKFERRLQNREESIDKKYANIDRKESDLKKKESELQNLENNLNEKQKELDGIVEEARKKVEEIAGMSQEAAKQELINIIEDEARHEAARKLKQIEEDLNQRSEELAMNIVALAAQRYAGDYASEKTISVVNLPSDDMKGRIIGREGRNIRSIEMRTGVDLIIDDTPETVVVSSLNPIRREVARISLEKLIADGRIHPARVEEIVDEVEKEVEKQIQKAGEDAVFDLGIHGMHPELIHHVGRLKYRSSYSQNILNHSIEVAFICGMLASEIGFDVKLAKRAGLLHDIGKSVDHETEGSHIDIGTDLVKKYGEPKEVIDAVAKAHDPQPQGVLPLLVQSADAISAARPGARRETYEAYIKRIQEIENIASSFHGVERCYAIQAGREVRVIVESSIINDEEATLLSHEISKKIEKEVAYPGQVKITVIRETRSIAYAS